MLTQRFDRALAFAADLHRAQQRKGTTIPYVSHLLAVASLVLEHGGSETEAIAALLHDAVEDQGGLPTLSRIADEFGEEVAAIVAGCTDADVVPKPPWRARKEAYIAHLAHASESICLVSAADKLHNLRSIVSDYQMLGEELWGRFNGKREGTLWYYQQLVDAFRSSALAKPRILQELEAVLAVLMGMVGTQKSL
jgi:(p)ppGpp synthase/HD superfamily hydrolase